MRDRPSAAVRTAGARWVGRNRSRGTATDSAATGTAPENTGAAMQPTPSAASCSSYASPDTLSQRVRLVIGMHAILIPADPVSESVTVLTS
ncbi:hypothetical protein GCM10009555_005550 [Acrocarpospora macrocephala]|uniref:Uncharacterized protein n=1 Tax=Acrocarpospora macrocephala TaxID=150177 RepID=A0A5M3X9J9_9ACTN|nr:hypothetical protein [Acrocarpospora macrocephala]GES14748.1 hypothetical protein Amac_083450 [Acrocarpospora macrocephala]